MEVKAILDIDNVASSIVPMVLLGNFNFPGGEGIPLVGPIERTVVLSLNIIGQGAWSARPISGGREGALFNIGGPRCDWSRTYTTELRGFLRIRDENAHSPQKRVAGLLWTEAITGQLFRNWSPSIASSGHG
jgi:hypothetical protein